MSKTITLPIKKVEKGETTITQKEFEIDEPTFAQFAKLSKVLNKAFDELKANGDMAELVDLMMKEDAPDATKEQKAAADQAFMMKAMGAFEFIAVKLPERLIEIIAGLSGIEQKVLEEQKITKVLDVYNAIFEANDIEALIARVKKSFGVTKSAMAFLRKKEKATQA